ncbi:MAG: C4-dicarboxylate ABC transporter [Gammaproteobacteria bacterium]|nr:MAG: C4-dicarboxylate ABC transporter [Gammaproteobacteria bacterium]
MSRDRISEVVVEDDLRLKHMPISFFAIVLGMVGFTLAVQKAEHIYHIDYGISTVLLYITLLITAVISVMYLLKGVFYPREIQAEFHNPIKINFFPIFAKVFLIYSVIFLDRSLIVSRYLWIVGAGLQFLFSIVIVSAWLNRDRFEIKHLNPAWFIPIVGNLIVPIAGVRHGFSEVSWFFFSIGVIFWLSLFIVILYRVFFHTPIPEKLVPTLFILFAPPAIGFISWVKLNGLTEFDAVGRIMLYFSLFMFVLVFAQAKKFLNIRFYLSWWAYTFPTAAISIASMLAFHMTGGTHFKYLAIVQLVILAVIILILLFKTVVEIINQRICIYEEE